VPPDKSKKTTVKLSKPTVSVTFLLAIFAIEIAIPRREFTKGASQNTAPYIAISLRRC